MKSVGIITMHKVVNSGSALQAYALLKSVQELGYRAELIDYSYPNDYHRALKGTTTASFFHLLFPRIKYFLLYRKKTQQSRFAEFWNRYYLQGRHYSSIGDIFSNPPIYDIYMTGSDQVWNPNNIGDDRTFFLNFSNSDNRISYAASFSVKNLPRSFEEIAAEELNHYKAISVRESSGKRLVEAITNRDATIVCDPTLLLNAMDYKALIDTNKRIIKDPYVLVYALDYAFDPFPAIDTVANTIAKLKHLKRIYLHANAVNHYTIGKSITSAGPCEFLNLFYYADFIVTSSFHGTVFSLVFEKPFASIVPDESHQDDRLTSLLREIGAESRIVVNGSLSEHSVPMDMDYSQIRPKLDNYIQRSKAFLKESLQQCQ